MAEGKELRRRRWRGVVEARMLALVRVGRG